MAWLQTPPDHVVDGALYVDTFFESERRVEPINIVITRTPRGGGRWGVPKLGSDLWKDRTLGEWLGDNPAHLFFDLITDREGVGTIVQLGGAAAAAVQAEHAETLGLGMSGNKVKDLIFNFATFSLAPSVIGRRIKG